MLGQIVGGVPVWQAVLAVVVIWLSTRVLGLGRAGDGEPASEQPTAAAAAAAVAAAAPRPTLVLVESRERDRPSERTPEKVAPGAAACAPPRTPPAAGSDAAAAAAAAETTSSSSSSSSSPERVRARSIASPVPGPREPPRRALRILHFNDVYDVLPSKREPAGGAALFVSKLRALSRSGGFGADGGAGGDDDGDDDEDDPGPLVLFSGDALSPSNISSTTKGRHMVEVLNACGVHCACVGNHDLDFGCEHFAAMQAESAFPWLCANAHHAVDGSDGMARGAALGGAQELCVLQHGGWRVGVVGLVEEEWLGACSTLDPSTLSYVDFVEAGRAAAQRLRGEHGCDVVIALTHLRLHNDLRLAAGCGDAVDLVLGGHDHDYHASCDNAHGCWVVKSGTDFRELSSLVIDPPARQQPAQQQQQQQQQQRPRPRPRVRAVARHEVRGDDVSIAPDAPTAALVGRYAAALAASMCKVVGRSAADLDARFAAVRTRETNVGNWVADMMRNGCQADIAICTGGTLRADCVFPAGPITEGALTKLLPFMDELRVVSLSGAQVVAALENGVSRWPVLDGRFPQVSGVAFAFDPRLPPGARVVAGSVRVGGSPSALEPLLQEAQYAVAVPDFVGRGKEGYSMFPEGRLMWDSEVCPILPTLVRNHLSQLNTTKNLEEWERGEAAEALVQGVQEAQQQQQQQQQVLLGRGAAGAEGGGGSEGSRSPSSLSRGSTPCSSPSPAVSFGLFTPRSPRSPSPMVADDAEADAEAGGDGAAAAAARAAAAAARSLCGTATAAEVMSLEVHDAARQPLGLFSPALITGLRRAESSPQLKSSRSFRRLSELAAAAAAAAAGSAEVGRPAADEGSNSGGGGGASSGDSDDAAQPPPPSLLQRVYSLPMPTEHATAASAGNRDGDGETDGDGDASGDSAPPPPPPSLQRVFSLPIFPQLRQQASFHGLRSPFNRTPRSTRSAMMVVHPVTEGRIFNAAPELLGQQ